MLFRTSFTASATTAPPAWSDRDTLWLLPSVKLYEPRVTQVPALAVWLTVRTVSPPPWLTVYLASVAAPDTLG